MGQALGRQGREVSEGGPLQCLPSVRDLRPAVFPASSAEPEWLLMSWFLARVVDGGSLRLHGGGISVLGFQT